MQNENVFPASRQDLGNLKQTAVDAAKDLGSTASVHADKARSQLNELARDVKGEANDNLNQVKGSLLEVANSARDYVLARPLTSLGIALGVGLFIGLCRRSRSDD